MELVQLHIATSADRALIVLNVPWSIYARKAVAIVASLAPDLESLGAIVCVIDEEAPVVRQWLNGTPIESLAGDDARGAGTILWLEHGAVFDVEIAGQNMTAQELLIRSRRRWGNNSIR